MLVRAEPDEADQDVLAAVVLSRHRDHPRAMARDDDLDLIATAGERRRDQRVPLGLEVGGDPPDLVSGDEVDDESVGGDDRSVELGDHGRDGIGLEVDNRCGQSALRHETKVRVGIRQTMEAAGSVLR